ncbi:uncharacterized protein N7511_003878 [Penicillium nucicola]|uniref:uncharacterized protein n=1 Tax=Penicillium nucicola TaxID=1850975 RepID=UPI002545AF8F|nr:uncharacterized protein N7511_003878 [Penicillium nucicola]KAJ5766262.1 hypothetical protein N7511_003878 [Penicillium nucicola]
MALLSRPSLRSVRREEPDGPKKHRLNRRRSSPDCLDTTTPDPKPRSNLPLKLARPRTSNRRDSSASVDSVASQLATPAARNGIGRTRARDPTPAIATDLWSRESPDPLDTISPAPSSVASKPRPGTPALTARSEFKAAVSPVTRATRRVDTRVSNDGQEKGNGHDGGDGGGDGAAEMRLTRNRNSDAGDGAQPEADEKQTGRRSLRSTDTGSRCKSELAQYFHSYEQIISLDDPEPESLSAKTTIILLDNLFQPLPFPSQPDPTPFGNPLLKLYGCEKINLREPAASPTAIDPLSAETYFRAHRKFERQEKQLRNIERDRAQHEQQVLERLLDELRGHDWLRVMGLPGVHESEKKQYEPKRDILISELVALVNKFQAWKDEERRRKLAREKPVLDESDAASRNQPRKRSRPAEDIDSSPAPGLDMLSTPDPNDVDALAARQLHQEARASAPKPRKQSTSRKPIPNTKITRTDGESHSHSHSHGHTHGHPNAAETPSVPQTSPKAKKKPDPTPPKNLKQMPLSFFYEPVVKDKPFTSFFRQKHVREAAIAATKGDRRGGSRSSLAFGQPVPDQVEHEFEPPAELLTDEAITASQRKRRRLKRQSHG